MSAMTRPTKWTDRFAFDIALRLEGSGEKLPEILKTHDFTRSDFLTIQNDPVFKKSVQNYRNEIREKGMTFKLKARAQAEELLSTSWIIIHSPDVPASVKADLIKSTVKWAGLEPKDTPTVGAAGGVTISINLDNANKEIPLNVTPRQPALDAA